MYNNVTGGTALDLQKPGIAGSTVQIVKNTTIGAIRHSSKTEMPIFGSGEPEVTNIAAIQPTEWDLFLCEYQENEVANWTINWVTNKTGYTLRFNPMKYIGGTVCNPSYAFNTDFKQTPTTPDLSSIFSKDSKITTEADGSGTVQIDTSDAKLMDFAFAFNVSLTDPVTKRVYPLLLPWTAWRDKVYTFSLETHCFGHGLTVSKE